MGLRRVRPPIPIPSSLPYAFIHRKHDIMHMRLFLKTSCLVLVAWTSSFTMSAQQLTKIAQIDGGSVSSLCANKFGDLYCSALNQVYRSIDQGQSWQKQKSPLDTVTDLQLVASNDENSLTALFALAGGRVWKTTDDGQRWSSSTGLDAFVAADKLRGLFAARYGALYACVQGEKDFLLLRSLNNGSTFDTVQTFPVALVSLVQSPDSMLYVLADRAYRVEPSKALVPIGQRRVVASYQEFFNAPVAVWSIENNTPFRSVNKGADWKDMSYDWKEKNGTIFTILIDREANAYAFVRDDDTTRVYRLNNGSTSWTKVRDVQRVFRDVLININGSFVASTDDGIYSSEDNGRSWTHTSRGISTYPLACAVALENAVCVGSFDGVLSQTNTGGLSWSTANIPPGTKASGINELIRTSKGRVVAATTQGIWVSADIGLNYIAAQLKDVAAQPVSSVAEVAPGVLYATANNALLTSRDDGSTWSVADSASYEGASVAKVANGRFVVSTSRGLLAGDTGSAQPVVLTTAMSTGRCAASASGTVYTAGYGPGIPGTYPVVLSRMKGKMMPESITIPSSRTSSRIPVWVATGSANEAYVNTDAGLYRISENSTTPERIDIPNEICTYVHSASSGTIIVATAYGGVYTLDVSSSVDGGSDDVESIAPQPAADAVTIVMKAPIGRWTIVDPHGNVCAEGSALGTDSRVTVATQSLASGVYVFMTESAGTAKRVPFVVVR